MRICIPDAHTTHISKAEKIEFVQPTPKDISGIGTNNEDDNNDDMWMNDHT